MSSANNAQNMLSLTGRYNNGRLRDSVSGALAGKNIIANVGNSNLNLGNTAGAILNKDEALDKLKLDKINILGSDQRKKYTTANQDAATKSKIENRMRMG